VKLKDGRVLDADLVVMAVGIQPETGLARRAGLATARGVVVDGAMRTSDPHIFAVGECAEHNGVCHGLVAPLYEMAKILAGTLAGEDCVYAPSAHSARLKVSGVDLFSAGDFTAGQDRDDLVLRDPERGIYRRLVIERDRLIGAILYGDTADSGFYLDLIETGADIASIRDALIFGRAPCEAA
jgi:nitrite reductase (NADH) large subunit